MAGDTSDPGEFSIGRGRRKDAGTGRGSPRGNPSAPQGERDAGQTQFDLGGTQERQTETGIPERLRRKYYVAETASGDEAKVYADPKGEYLAFKVSAERTATRLEDASVIRDMVSIAQHRGWKKVELRGSEEFRRTAWLEASVRGLSVRGYEPDPVDRAALSFRTKPDVSSTRGRSQSPQREPQASETTFVAGVSTKRPIDVTVMPPERSAEPSHPKHTGAASFLSSGDKDAAWVNAGLHSADRPVDRSAITIDVLPFRAATSDRPSRTAGERRADMFRSGDSRRDECDDVVKAARSQMAAIERALAKAVRDPALRRSVLAHAKERIAEQLERGGEFEHAELSERRSDATTTRQSKSSRFHHDR